MSRASKHYMDRVRELPCIVCLYKLGFVTKPVSAHHVTVPADDYAVAPLCYEHHQGSTGVHGLHRREFKRMWKLNEVGLLTLTNRAMTENK